MSVLLFVIGALTLVVGVATIGFGIPINEFSFGNTLIMAGTTATVGGLILIAIGAVVAQLRRINEALSAGAEARTAPVPDAFEPPVPGRIPAGGMPFPARPRPEPVVPGPAPVPLTAGPEAAEESRLLAAEPMLRNPEAQMSAEVEPSLSPLRADAAAPPPFGRNGPARGEQFQGAAHEAAYEPGWRPPEPPPEPRSRATNFDAMWPPPRPRPEQPTAGPPERPGELVHDTVPLPSSAEPEPSAVAKDDAPRAAAILKSGVVDGMGYTLYVDGSIEAELPQGTLRFASINELRSHLEKNP